MPKTLTIELPPELLIEFKKPISFNGKTVSAITLEEPTIGQIEKAQKLAGSAGSMALIRELIALVANESKEIVAQMKISDVNKASEYLMSFIAPSPTTSETSSET